MFWTGQDFGFKENDQFWYFYFKTRVENPIHLKTQFFFLGVGGFCLRFKNKAKVQMNKDNNPESNDKTSKIS